MADPAFPPNQTVIHEDIERIRAHVHHLEDGDMNAEPHGKHENMQYRKIFDD